MEKNKSSLFIAMCAAAVLFALPDVSAQQPTNPPTGAGGQTMSTTIVEDQPEQVTLVKKTLWQLIRNGGLMMWPLGLLALYGFYKAGEQIYAIVFSNNRARDQGLVTSLKVHVMPFDDLIGKVTSAVKQHEQAAFPRMCEAALEQIYQGKEATEEALIREGELQLSRLKRGLKPLQTVVTVAPLLGLMGTVYGMIASFQSLGATGDKVEILSKGIYEALVTTAAGLTIAIPFLFIYQWLNHRSDEVGENLNRQGAALLEKFYPSVGGEANRENEAQESAKLGETAADSEPPMT